MAARPNSPRHGPIVAGMSTTAIAVAKYANERHQLWHDTKVLLKRLIVDSLGPTLSVTFGPPPHGFTLLSIRDIMDDVNAKFENVDAVALDALGSFVDPFGKRIRLGEARVAINAVKIVERECSTVMRVTP